MLNGADATGKFNQEKQQQTEGNNNMTAIKLIEGTDTAKGDDYVTNNPAFSNQLCVARRQLQLEEQCGDKGEDRQMQDQRRSKDQCAGNKQ